MTRGVKVGPASDPTSDMGSSASTTQCRPDGQIVKDAIADGAKIVVRGGRVTAGATGERRLLIPTLLEVTIPLCRSSSKKSSGRS